MQQAFRCMRWRPLVVAVLLIAAICPSCASASSATFSYDMVHRFSERGRAMLQYRIGENFSHWPARNSFEYHNLLFQLDQRRHSRGRQLRTQYLSFSGDNTTLQWLASLHYAIVEVGTPKVSFFAALDTGSDLTWFPCDCIQCASLDDPRIDPSIRPSLGTYSPGSSTTSENVTCNDSLCSLGANCSRASDWCPYEISYVSANTGSQGNLVRDVLYLGDDLQPGGQLQTAPIVFGCGRRQSGDFIDSAALNGLVGLGYQAQSIPSVLAQQGVIANSFSICLSVGGEGRLVFGDKGVPGQSSTPFLAANNAFVSYVVQAESISVGSKAITAARDNFYFDTGTSYTYLLSGTYQAFIKAFDSGVPTSYRRTTYTNIPFELCYRASASASSPYFDYPNVTFTWLGGDTLELAAPILELETTDGNIVGFCLAVFDGGSVALFGQNFMTGYRFTFNREDNVLGWTKATCYDQALSGASGAPVTPPSLPPLPISTPVPTPFPSAPIEAPVLPPIGPPPPPAGSRPISTPPPPLTVTPPPRIAPPPPPAATGSNSSRNTGSNSSGNLSPPIYLLSILWSVLAVTMLQLISCS